jgi:hypothetical protein
MRIAYVFSTSGHTASYKLGKMILPQLEKGTHGVEVAGMFFFDDNNYVLRKGALERELATGEPGNCEPAGVVDGVTVGCFPDLYGALAQAPPDQVITL